MRLKLFLILLLCAGTVYAQKQLPVIKANSTAVTIRDGNYLIANTWVLSPKLRPDIYRTANSTATEQVTFYTDIDSISFIKTPGKEYDFIILYKQKDSCYTRISTLHGTKIIKLTDSWFLEHKLFIFCLLAVLFVAGYYIRKRFSNAFLLAMGIITPVLFWGSTIVGGILHGQYDHISNIVSELGATGTRSAQFMAIAEVCMSITSSLFIYGLWRACRLTHTAVIPLIPLLVFPLCIIGIAFYTLDNPLHATMGSIMLAIAISPLIAILLWRKKEFKLIRIGAFLSILLFLMLLCRFLPFFQQGYDGLVQRFFHAGWTVWFITLALGLKKARSI